MSFTTHHSVIGCLKDWESQAWETFFKKYSVLIRLHGKDCGIHPDGLDDLVQNVMISVLRNGRNFDYSPSRGRFRDYLKKIIRARAADLLRQYYRKTAFMAGEIPDKEERMEKCPDERESPDEAMDQVLDSRLKDLFTEYCLQQLKHSVSAKHYQIFHMLDIQKISVSSIAEFFGMPLVSVYSIRARTEAKLREIAKKTAERTACRTGEIFQDPPSASSASSASSVSSAPSAPAE